MKRRIASIGRCSTTVGILLLAAGALAGLGATEMARPFGEPTPKTMTTTIGFYLRHTEPDAEGGSEIPRFILNWNSPLFGEQAGRMRMFFNGTYADGEVLVTTKDVAFGFGGFFQPLDYVDREYLAGVEQAGTEVNRVSYGGRVMLGTLNQDASYLHNTEMLMFYQWGFEDFHRRARTDTNFIMPHGTSTESWGFTIGFDDAWQTKTEETQQQAGGFQAPTEHTGSYFQLMGIFTHRLNWHAWGSPTRFNNAAAADSYYPKVAMAGGMDQNQVSGDQVNFSVNFRAGWGDNLDRFSAFRLGGGTDLDRDLNRAPLYGYHWEEFLADRFATFMVDFGVKFNGLNGNANAPAGNNGQPIPTPGLTSSAAITRYHIYYQHAILNEMNEDSDQMSKKLEQKKAAGMALTTSYINGVYIRVDVAYGFDAVRQNGQKKGGWEGVFSAQSSF
ncbi:MAG: hypothetical protein ACREJ2_16360 [Planctomycetota bacterium]